MEGPCRPPTRARELAPGRVSNPEVITEADASRGGAPSAAGAGRANGVAAPEFVFMNSKNLSARLRSASGASKLMGARTGMLVPFAPVREAGFVIRESATSSSIASGTRVQPFKLEELSYPPCGQGGRGGHVSKNSRRKARTML